MSAPGDLVKVFFGTALNGPGMGKPEFLWAKQLSGGDSKHFEIQHSPFYADGVSYLDVVAADAADNEINVLAYRSTVRASGRSTFRVLVPKESKSIQETKSLAGLWLKLQRLGCLYDCLESGPFILYSLDVPSDANFIAVSDLLNEGRKNAVWVFDEAHRGHNRQQQN